MIHQRAVSSVWVLRLDRLVDHTKAAADVRPETDIKREQATDRQREP